MNLALRVIDAALALPVVSRSLAVSDQDTANARAANPTNTANKTEIVIATLLFTYPQVHD